MSEMAKIRGLLDVEPSPQAFWRILRYFDGCGPGDETDMELDYVARHLEDWPDRTRRLHLVQPDHRHMLEGLERPHWRLVRQVSTIRDDFGLDLAKAPCLEHLTSIKFGSLSIGDGIAMALAQNPSTINLQSLTLYNSRIMNVGAVALANSPYLKKLRWLDLYCSHIGTRGVQALLESPNFPCLEVLDLSGSMMSTPGLAQVQKATRKGLTVLT